MNHALKFYQKNNLEIKIPNNENKKVLIKILNIENGVDQEWGNDIVVVTINVINKKNFKYFTDSMFEFFINKEIKQHLSLFSIEGEVVLSFR
jgi:hypothetical protein